VVTPDVAGPSPEIVEDFLEFACWDNDVHGKADHRLADRAAGRLLAQHPGIARHSLHAAVVCGDLVEVERRLAERPQAALERGGTRQWTPLLHLCFTRFTHEPTTRNAVAIGRALLDRGANPNDAYPACDVPYTALVGAAGEGEQDAPRQPQGEALFELLLDRGAEPFDTQVLYNTHFSGDVLWWLKLVHARTQDAERGRAWRDPDWRMFDMGAYGSGARYLLWIAIQKDDAALAEWVLARGANPNAAAASDPRFSKRSLYEDAVREGRESIAELLLQYGAKRIPLVLEGEEAFVAACLALDRAAADAQAKQHPEYLASPKALFAAAQRDRADAVALLLELGTPIEIADAQGKRALHVAASHNSLGVARLLVERGAEIDPREKNWNAAPIGFAAYGDHLETRDFLSRHSRNVWVLAFRGYLDRLRDVLAADPGLAKERNREGLTPLFFLPDDEPLAAEIARLLLSHGADPTVVSPRGRTAADWARKRGMNDLARVLAY
jgi:ankyrin repeat protein